MRQQWFVLLSTLILCRSLVTRERSSITDYPKCQPIDGHQCLLQSPPAVVRFTTQVSCVTPAKRRERFWNNRYELACYRDDCVFYGMCVAGGCKYCFQPGRWNACLLNILALTVYQNKCTSKLGLCYRLKCH